MIAYAQDRGIRVVPEFDIPGHTTSWLVGYPELASAPGPYQIERNWGVFDPTMDPTRESTYEFLDAFIGEMAALFPDPFFHIGGDEVTGKQWKSSPRIRAFMRKNHLKTHRRSAGILQSTAAKSGGEVRKEDGGLGRNSRSGSAERHRDSILARAEVARGVGAPRFFGHPFGGLLSRSHGTGVQALCGGSVGWRRRFAARDEEKRRILGGEVAMWGEFVSPENVDSRIWPRAAAVAERLWSPQEVRDVPSMYRRLEQVSRQSRSPGLTHRSSYFRCSSGWPPAIQWNRSRRSPTSWQPATFGQRIRTHRYTQLTPLNRLVDAARPESDTAREFAALVDRMDRVANANLAYALARQRCAAQADARKSDLLRKTFRYRKLCSRLGSIGLQALDYLDRGERPPDAWLAQQRAFLETLKKPIGRAAAGHRAVDRKAGQRSTASPP